MKSRVLVLFFGSVALAGWSGCSRDPAASEESAAAAATKADCSKVFFEKEQRFLSPKELADLKDPVAALILAGTDCPGTLQEISDKLRKTDNGGDCAADDPKGPPRRTDSHFVSERGAELGAIDSYRDVITRRCSGRSNHGLFISVFGIGPDSVKALPQDVELIGQDATTGVFDFYAREDGKWKFFGTSMDLIADGYDCDANGACVPKASGKTRCASCHVGGGLVMKELNSPWVNWSDSSRMPSLDPLFAKHSQILGRMSDGPDLESRVEEGNAEWIPGRIAFLKARSATEVLRPLFCTVDVNLATRQTINSVQSDFLLASTWGVLDSVPVNSAHYPLLIAANNQRIIDSQTKKPMVAGGKPVTDTALALTYPTRSKLDGDYVKALVTKKIVDDDFVKDVLAIDITRPIFSASRCSLLQFAPNLSGDAITPKAIRDGFVANLASAKGDGATLLGSLKNPNDAAEHKAAAKAFVEACKARPKKDFLTDVLVVASHLRTAVRNIKGAGGQGIIEFQETLVVDDVPDDKRALDPVDCTLK